MYDQETDPHGVYYVFEINSRAICQGKIPWFNFMLNRELSGGINDDYLGLYHSNLLMRN